MLYEADFVQLEICVAAYLSQDPVLLHELRTGVDLHSDNQVRFKLPTRLIAKTFVFRILYGGSAYAFSKDPEFNYISKSKNYWQRAINEFYAKYKGIEKWHEQLVEEVVANGSYYGPTGREYKFAGLSTGRVPYTDIKNYIVQGTGADLLGIARVLVAKELQNVSRFVFYLRTTVHDSILIESSSPKTEGGYDEKEEEQAIKDIIVRAWAGIQPSFESRFGVEWNVPCRVELKKGPNWGQMKVFYKG